MSQIYKAVTAGNLPPSVPTSFVLDTGTAIPLANVMLVNGAPNTSIKTTLGASNQIYINTGITGDATTTDATPTVLLSVPLGASAGVYTVDIKIVAYCTAGPDSGNGNGYTVTGAVLTNGSTGTKLGTEAIDEFEGISAIVRPTFTTSGNNAVITVTGLASDTINWRAEAEYIFRGTV